MKEFVKITPKVMEYAWGNKDFIPNLIGIERDGQPKAELWMGTHPGAPSLISETKQTLESFLMENINFFSSEHIKTYNKQIPFLFKVLAIEKSLSIQCHPDYKAANIGYEGESEFRKTNDRSLWNYKDSNRKAEVVYALTPITAMCGFLSDEEIIENLKKYIPKGFNKYILNLLSTCDNKAKVIFEYIYRADLPILEELIKELLINVESCEAKNGEFFTKEGIINRVKSEYPKDCGLFAPLLLNVVHLKPGEALYLEPRVLHSYVYGNSIELMSASDNVLRGGLTNKKIDVDELLKVVDIKELKIKKCKTRLNYNKKTVIETPTDEFILGLYKEGKFDIRTINLQMLLFTDNSIMEICGKSISVNKGEVYVIAANTHYKLKNKGDVFIATC